MSLAAYRGTSLLVLVAAYLASFRLTVPHVEVMFHDIIQPTAVKCLLMFICSYYPQFHQYVIRTAVAATLGN